MFGDEKVVIPPDSASEYASESDSADEIVDKRTDL